MSLRKEIFPKYKFSAFAAIGALALPVALVSTLGVPPLDMAGALLATSSIMGAFISVLSKSADLAVYGISKKEKDFKEKYGTSLLLASKAIEGAIEMPLIIAIAPGAIAGEVAKGMKNMAVEEVNKLREKLNYNYEGVSVKLK